MFLLELLHQHRSDGKEIKEGGVEWERSFCTITQVETLAMQAACNTPFYSQSVA